MFDFEFWKARKVFVTGHTGFKGSWLCVLLMELGADVNGYALEPLTEPSMYTLCNIDAFVNSTIADIRIIERLKEAISNCRPEIIIHMAAQPLVKESYINPLGTYETNVMGVVNLFEAVRECKSVKAVINVTTDKCYENREWLWGYRENEPMGGFDPYSNSKACSELITASYRNSFFNNDDYGKCHSVAVASARAGNVIGGGDWAKDRLVPDCIKALMNKEKIVIRHPDSLRPWQHVLEPLSGYLLLAENLSKYGPLYSEGWNFGPELKDEIRVAEVVKFLCECWGENSGFVVAASDFHEAGLLRLDSSKARTRLKWLPRWSMVETISKIVEWNKALANGGNMLELTRKQITDYLTEA